MERTQHHGIDILSVRHADCVTFSGPLRDLTRQQIISEMNFAPSPIVRIIISVLARTLHSSRLQPIQWPLSGKTIVMTIPITLWKAIARPVSQDGACGDDLRQDERSNRLLYHVRHLRHQASTEERRATLEDVDFSTLHAIWQEIFAEVTELLTKRTKDLELLAYLLEAGLRLDGFMGLHRALEAATQLIVEYWPELHPCIDDEELRVRHLNGLNGFEGDGTLLPVIVTTPLLPAPDGDPITLARHLRAESATGAKKTDRRAKKEDLLESIKADALAVPSEIVEMSRDTLNLTFNAFEEFDAQLTNRARTTFFSSAIRARLLNCQEAFTYICGAAPTPAEAAPDMNINEHESAAKDTPAASPESNPKARAADAHASEQADFSEASLSSVTSRQQALASLSEIAVYFERHEPHSPVGYAIRQIIGWGNMELPQLLEHLIPDPNARANFFLLSGIPIPNESDLD